MNLLAEAWALRSGTSEAKPNWCNSKLFVLSITLQPIPHLMEHDQTMSTKGETLRTKDLTLSFADDIKLHYGFWFPSHVKYCHLYPQELWHTTEMGKFYQLDFWKVKLFAEDTVFLKPYCVRGSSVILHQPSHLILTLHEKY